MDPSSTDPPSDSTGPPDRRTLRLLERHLASDPLVAETDFDPATYEPRVLRVLLDTDRYPEAVSTVRLDVRWFTTGDFSFHYVEEHGDADEPSDERTDGDGERWECRWDRHPNAHNTRSHFHRPPTAEDIVDLEFPSVHPLDVHSTVLSAIARRVDRLWSNEQ